jgi:hypothetical protein
MSLKNMFIATAVWTVVVVALGIGMIIYIGTHPVAGATVEQRSQMAGSGVGFLAALGYAGIWLPFAFKKGQERRKVLDKASAVSKKRINGKTVK